VLSNLIKKLFYILLFCFATAISYAAGFVATVDSKTISFGQSLTVQLRLEDAKALESIDISPFAKDFMIYNQQQFSSYRNVNGTVKAESGWNVTLMPKKEGEFLIPAISLETDQGRFSTQEIKISVQHPKAGDKSTSDGIGISLVSIVSKSKAYVNEPIIYTLKIISYKPIANIVLDDIKSSEAIIEKIGEPKQSNQTLGGVNAHVIEIRYAVTALRTGKVTIAPAIMHGELQVISSQARRPQRFGIFNDMFMDNMIELKPFSLQSDTITIEALPAVVKGNDWLPLYNLNMSEKFDGIQNAKVGETITRKIKIIAKGAFAKQLPSVKDFIDHEHVKTYANKPTFSDTLSESAATVVGTREEEYSLVPQQEGTITLPAIKINWYNLQSKKIETTVLPEKTITVAPGVVGATPNVTIDYSNEDKPQEVLASKTQIQTKPAWLYILLGILGGVLFTGMLGSLLFIGRRKIRQRARKIRINPKKQKSQEIEITSAENLRNYILQYAIKNWQAPKDIALNRLGDNLTNKNYKYDTHLYLELCENFNAALYGSAAIELEFLISKWNEFKTTVVKNSKLNKSVSVSEDYASLNPT
jgi:hypothetical protein